MNKEPLWRRLANVYDAGEAKAIARMVYEVRYGLTLADLMLGKDQQLSAEQQEQIEQDAQRLLRQEPVQYVLGQADFCGRTFVVNPHVLIPRPETEDLCRWVIEDCQWSMVNGQCNHLSILDIGTGSGCIAITLAAELPESEVTAWDISEEALRVASQNAQRNDVHVSFARVDILQCSMLNGQWSTVNGQWSMVNGQRSMVNVIVSNPPYICNKERATMEQNVLAHEPHTALFVPDDDPLLFYRAIARYALTALKPQGMLYFEINPLYDAALHDLLSNLGYRDIEIRQDQFGKPRMMKARR